MTTPDPRNDGRSADAIARALHASDARFRDLIERNADGIVVVGQDGLIRYANAAAESLLDRTRHALEGRPFGIPVLPGAPTELDLPRPDGSVRIAEMRVVSTDWEGAPAYLCSLRDMTERRRAEAELFRREQEFRLLADNAPDPIVRIDRALRIRYANPAAIRTIGLGTPFLDRPFAEAAPAFPAVDHLRGHLRDVLASREGSTVEFDLDIDGLTRSFQGRIVPEFDPLGEIETLLLIARDITDRKRLELELRRQAEDLAEADRRKDQFLATLGHELRNPLAPILNAAEVLRLRADPEVQAPMREMIAKKARHLARLVDDLLDVSRIRLGKVGLRKQRVAFNELVAGVVEGTRPASDAKEQDVRLVLPAQPVDLDADPTRIEQIVQNLVGNAVKYTPPGGSIRVSLAAEGPDAVLRVADDGIGLAPEWLPRVFDLFSQAEEAIGQSQGGLGIGLTMVRNLVELHGGTVEARSDGPGRGSEFIVRLPALDGPRPVEDDGATGAPARPQASLRVLIVDDNADSADSLSILVDLWGHEPRVLNDGLAVARILPEFRPEVVLLDIGLPGMDGYTVAREIRRMATEGQPVLVAMTGFGREEDRQRAIEAGFDHHLVKPVDLVALEALLNSCACGEVAE